MAAPYNPPVKNEDFKVRIALSDYAIPGSYKSSPTIAAGDFKVDKDVTLLRFVLNVEGRERPGSVEIGANNTKINNLPLLVRLR